MFRKNDTQEDILSLIDIPVMEEQDTPVEDFSCQQEDENMSGKDNIVYPLSLEEALQDTSLQEYKIETIAAEDSKEEILQERKEESIKKIVTLRSKTLQSLWFFTRYISTSGIIFGVLLLTTNYQAYYSLAHSFIFQGKMIEKQEGLLSSVEAGNLQKEEIPELQAAGEENIREDIHSVQSLVARAHNDDVNLDITITPYENRIIIPKIGKNIPLLEVQEEKVSGLGELNNIFMKELESGVVRYPGSGKPGKVGNAFVFGHSSNFPWIKGEYNDVFALLGNVEIGDEVVVYYDQQKYTYQIREKTVITPDDVSILKRKPDAAELTLMTCWPIGTDLERLILIAELVESK